MRSICHLILFMLILTSCNNTLDEKIIKTKKASVEYKTRAISRDKVLSGLELITSGDLKGKCIIIFSGFGKFGQSKNECMLVSFLSDNIEPDSVVIKFSKETNDDIIIRIPDSLAENLHDQLKECVLYELLLSLDTKIINLKQGDKIALMSIKNGGVVLSNWNELSQVENVLLPVKAAPSPLTP